MVFLCLLRIGLSIDFISLHMGIPPGFDENLSSIIIYGRMQQHVLVAVNPYHLNSRMTRAFSLCASG